MAYEQGLQRFSELKRLVANDCIITEEGVYAPDELPEDYEGSFEGTLQVVYAVVHVDIAGRLRYTTYSPPDLKNKDNDTGLPLEAQIGRNTVTLRSGSNSPTVTLEWIDNPNLPENLQTIANLAWNSLVEQAEEGSWSM